MKRGGDGQLDKMTFPTSLLQVWLTAISDNVINGNDGRQVNSWGGQLKDEVISLGVSAESQLFRVPLSHPINSLKSSLPKRSSSDRLARRFLVKLFFFLLLSRFYRQ